MKWSGKCPKCGCEHVLRVEGSVGPHRQGNNITLGFTNLSAIMVHRYVCSACGFTEEWIDQEDIPKLKEQLGYI